MQYYCAIRPGDEMRSLRISDFSFHTSTVTIKNIHAKNNRTESIAIPAPLMNILQNHYELQKYPYDYYVFGKKGCPDTQKIDKNTLRLRHNKFRDQLNITDEVKLYSWKHSGAQELSNAGINTYDLCRHLRHKSIVTTEHYIRKRLGEKNEIIRNNFPDI